MFQVVFVVLMLVAIGLHEAGHFGTAKWFGIKVDKFFIGFGPRIWSIRRGETEYGFGWIPAGGYVRIAGMNPFEEIAPEDRMRTFKAKKPWQRAVVLVAGSTTHFVIAFIVLAFLLGSIGLEDGPATRTIESVSKSSAAAAAGFKAGDEILSVEGTPAFGWDEIRNYIRSHPGEPVTFDVVRKGERVSVTATLDSRTPEGEQAGFLGVATKRVLVKRSAGAALWESTKAIGVGSWDSLKALGRIVSPSTIAHLFRVAAGTDERRPDDPASIVGITRAAGSFDGTTLLLYVVGFNIFVGVANLLPLPPLDGGHLAVLAWEKITRRDVDMRRLLPVTATVISVLVGLFLISLYLDIVQPLPTLPG